MPIVSERTHPNTVDACKHARTIACLHIQVGKHVYMYARTHNRMFVSTQAHMYVYAGSFVHMYLYNYMYMCALCICTYFNFSNGKEYAEHTYCQITV